MQLDTATQCQVFAAAQAAAWRANNLGTHAQVTVGGSTYTVTVESRRVLAYIDAVQERGGITWVSGANATVDEHRGLVAAAGV